MTSKGTVLIIEDNQGFRKIYGDRLNYEGFVILEANDGEEGIKMLQTQPVDLVITDLNMPKMDGYAVIEAIRKDETFKTLPILVMSVFDTPEHFNRARELGANGYIVKGTQTPNEVTKKVLELVPAHA